VADSASCERRTFNRSAELFRVVDGAVVEFTVITAAAAAAAAAIGDIE